MTNNEGQALNNIACGDPVESGQVHPESALPSVPVKGANPETKRAALTDALRHAALNLLDHNRAAGACIEIEGAPPLYVLVGHASAMGKLLPEATKPRVSEQAGERVVQLDDEILDSSHGPTRLLLLAEHWKREAQKARAALTQQAAPEAPTLNAEAIQWRNIQKVVLELAAFCFGSADQSGSVSFGAAYTALVTALTAKDGLSVKLEPLCAPVMQHSASASELPEPLIVELYRESFKAMVGRLREPPQYVSPSVLDFARAIEAEVASRFRAQGGNTNTDGSKNLASPAATTASASGKCSACAGKDPFCGHCDGMGIEPRELVEHGDCKCVLSQYCDGKCNPIYADEQRAPAPSREAAPLGFNTWWTMKAIEYKGRPFVSRREAAHEAWQAALARQSAGKGSAS